MNYLLVFSDLDGTLLDHDNYGWEEARPALEKINDRGVPLILSSSKTAAEIAQLRDDLGNRHPYIVENGGALAVPVGYFEQGEKQCTNSPEWIRFAPEYGEIVEVINQIRTRYGYRFVGFNDLSPVEIAGLTGLSIQNSIKAKMRESSEPLVWQDQEKLLVAFKRKLHEHCLDLTKGGRFYHVMGRTDKAKGVEWLLQRYRDAWPQRTWISVSLGDGPNDLGMLEAVDIAVVMKPAHGEPLRLRSSNRVIYSQLPGPRGWCLVMEQILGDLLDG